MKNAKIKNLKNHVQIEKNGDFYMEMLRTLNRKSDTIFTNPPFSTDLKFFAVGNAKNLRSTRSKIFELLEKQALRLLMLAIIVGYNVHRKWRDE